LTSWLKDPQAIKPETMMPNLGLSEDEIKALTDFINAGKDD
jgi:cytochrome c1